MFQRMMDDILKQINAGEVSGGGSSRNAFSTNMILLVN